MIEEALSKFEDKVRLLIAHVSLLKKENLSLRNQIIEQTAGSGVPNRGAVQAKIRQIIQLIDTELEAL